MCMYFHGMPCNVILNKQKWPIVELITVATNNKAFVVSGTNHKPQTNTSHKQTHSTRCLWLVHQSPSNQQSRQWEPQTAVSSLIALISVAYPLIHWITFLCILTIHHKIRNTCGFRKVSTTDGLLPTLGLREASNVLGGLCG